MKTMTKRLILATCVISITEVAMAAIPKTTIEPDTKNARIVNVVATSAAGDKTNYHCHYAWEVTLTGAGTSNDACEADVPAGSDKVAVCTKTYAKRVSETRILDASCMPI